MVHDGDKQVGTVLNLRDWFAGQALMGAFSGSTHWPASEETWAAFAWSCYGISEAMLKERKKHLPHVQHHVKQHSPI